MSLQADEKSTSPEVMVEPGTPGFMGDSKDVKTDATVELAYADSNEELHRPSVVADSAEALVTQVISVEDDPTMNALTFRMFFLGIGLSVFASVLQEIFFFKPQTVYVSTVFLTVIAYILGEAMSVLIPRWGPIGRFLNPFPFNLKEHAAITLMASAGGQSAQATQALAAQQLFYGGYPSRAAGIFVVLSSQLIGYGLAGLLRTVLVYPTKMLWPMNLPITSLLESLHKDKVQAKQRLRIFYIVFFILFVWEVFPQYIFTVLEGLSIFCLAQQNSLVFTNLFGGSSGNEGLGFLSLSFDWQFIAPFWSPLWYPLQTLTNNFIGYLGCILVFMVVYYQNIWDAQNFPFLSQLLFSDQSNSTNYVLYNQTNILTADNVIDPTLLYQEGIPSMTATYLVYLITSNMGLTAALMHMFLWNRDDLKAAWEWIDVRKIGLLTQASTWQFWKDIESPEERLARKEADPKLDPHYKLMLRNMYRESPLWWWGATVVISWVVGLGCLYGMNSTLPWWGFILATILTCIFMLFLGAQYGLTGFQFNVQPICQMIGGYLFPNKPIANMYFTCYTFNTLQMGQVLCKDLKLAQQVHLAPRITFVMQVMGCIIGALFNFLMMIVIVDNQAPILSSIEGSNIWSGQLIQQFNTLAISWSIAGDMFSVGAKYQWVTISFLLGFIVPVPFWLAYKFFPKFRLMAYLNTSIILWYMGNLFVGVNSGFLSFFLIGFISQFYLRKYHPQFFIKYNYIVSAALDGGSQVMVFILTFAVFGGSGNAVSFPNWAGNPDRSVRNLDYCMLNPANSG